MKNHLLTLVAFYILTGFILSENINAQGFNSITTPDGVNMVAVGNSGKYYRSGNGGVAYSSYTLAGAPTLKSVTSFGNDVWMAGQNGNVIKTLKTISPNTVYNVGSSVTLNSIAFISSLVGYVCGDGGALYKSVDGGATWASSNTGLPSVKLNSVAFVNANNGVVAGDNGTIFRTSDGGTTWNEMTSGTTRNILKIKYIGSQIIAVGEYGTLLTSGGATWNSVATRTDSDIRGVSGTSVSEIHVCGGGGFIRNNKSGSDNFFNFEINPMLANLSDIFFYDSNKGWAVSSLNNVIIYTTNGGSSWSMPEGATVSMSWIQKTPSGSGIGNNLCMHPKDRNSMFVVYGNSVFVSRNRGETWSSIATISIGSRAHSFYVSPVDTNVWLAAMESSPDCVVRSTNYGANWTNVIGRDFSTYGQPLEMDQNNPSVFYFAPSNAGGAGFFKSTDNGATFNLVAPYNNSNIGQPCDIVVQWDNSNIIFLGDDGADIWKSVNGGLNWTSVKPGSSSEVPSMCNSVFDTNLCYATTWSSSDVYRTVNGGNNWSVISSNSGSGWGSDLCREDPTVVLTGNYGAQAYLSTNGGSSFFNVNTGLNGAGAGIMVPERGLMFNMQTGNLYKLNITYTDAPVQAAIDVQALSLGQTGIGYFPMPVINPTGFVKNNNGVAPATFTVTRRISPGNYISSKLVSGLAPLATYEVVFDQWTFDAGTVYNISDSVYISDDTDPVNDVLTATLTPYLGSSSLALSQGFTGTFPPSGWTTAGSGTIYWKYSAASSYGVGAGSAKYDFWNAPNGSNQSMLTPTFGGTIAGDSVEYDYAYTPYSGSVDSLIIETSTNGGNSFSTLARLYGSSAGTIGQPNVLTTVIGGGSNYTPSAGQWLKRKWGLPVGTNKIKFRAVSGFGNNLYLDSIKILSGNLYTQFNVNLAPEGMYNGTTLNMKDTVKAYMRNTSAPFTIVDSAVAVLDSVNLKAAFVFMNAPTGNYYIQVKHRNSLETWSKNGVSLTRGITGSYDFTTSNSQAYGDNMVLNGTKYCFYSGDVNSDGTVTLADIISVYNASSSFSSGYVINDLNGDRNVTLADIIIVYNNSSKFVAKVTPEGSMLSAEEFRQKSSSEMRDFLKKNINEAVPDNK